MLPPHSLLPVYLTQHCIHRLVAVVFAGNVGPQLTGRTEFYFGSLASIYEVFSSKDIGCLVTNFWRVGVSDGYPYENRKCRITKEPVIR